MSSIFVGYALATLLVLLARNEPQSQAAAASLAAISPASVVSDSNQQLALGVASSGGSGAAGPNNLGK